MAEQIGLDSLVRPTSFRNPAVFAKQIDAIEEISDGRVILGLGAGWNEPEYTAFGLPFDKRVSRFEDAFTIIRPYYKRGRSTWMANSTALVTASLGREDRERMGRS